MPVAASVAPVPEGFFTLTPQITVQDVETATKFYVAAFGAEVRQMVHDPEGRLLRAQVRIGDSIVVVRREEATSRTKAPITLGGNPTTLLLYLDDADAIYSKALEAGAVVMTPVEERFWGDRYGEVMDPDGHRWALATHVEDLTPQQLRDRAALIKTSDHEKSRKKSSPPKWRAIAGTPAADPTPAPYHTLTITLTTQDTAAAIDFYEAAFGAKERDVVPNADGKIIRAEVTIGDSILLLNDEDPQRISATTLGGSPLTVQMYVENAVAAVVKATRAGAEAAEPLNETIWGDRQGEVIDDSGFTWELASRIEELSVAELEARLEAQQ